MASFGDTAGEAVVHIFDTALKCCMLLGRHRLHNAYAGSIRIGLHRAEADAELTRHKTRHIGNHAENSD